MQALRFGHAFAGGLHRERGSGRLDHYACPPLGAALLLYLWGVVKATWQLHRRTVALAAVRVIGSRIRPEAIWQVVDRINE